MFVPTCGYSPNIKRENIQKFQACPLEPLVGHRLLNYVCAVSLMHVNINMETLGYKGAEFRIVPPSTSFRPAWLKGQRSLF